MERTKETLEARVRETPLVDRLKECQQRIGNMCAELRGPKMSIPVEYYDDDFYICTTLADAQATVEALQRVRDEFEHERDQLHAALMEAKAALDAEREKVKGLHEITKVICAHCCEPMEIPSKAALQTQLTQLQALMRAFFTSEDKWAVAYRELERLGYTLDATTPAPDTSIIGKCEPPSQWDPNAQVRGDIS